MRLLLHLAALLLLVGGSLASPTAAAAAPARDDIAQMAAAARQRVAQVAPGVPLERVEVVRVVGDYAIVAVVPPAEVTDPAGVVLKLQLGTWTAVAGPGTAFPPGSRGGAPDELFEFGPPTVAQRS